MFIQNLKLTHFKNYDSGSFEFSDGFNIVVGLNGMGKTNLLDAIYYLCIGKSYFTTRDLHVVQRGNEFFRVEGTFSKEGAVEHMLAKVIPGKSKELIRNAKTYDRLAEHIGLLPVVIISPRDIQLFYEGSAERRKFLDYSISQYNKAYLTHLNVYHKLLKQRNALLKQKDFQKAPNFELLEAYHSKMSVPAIYISEQRQNFIRELSPVFSECYSSISNKAEDSTCSYKSELLERDFIKLQTENLQKDILLQRTTSGIHKDDLEFSLNGMNLKTFGSQGQLKTFVLGLKLAQYSLLNQHTAVKPILLLDDLFDRLDDKRVGELLSLLNSEKYGQVFISDTHDDKLKRMFDELKIPFSCFTIEKGKLIHHEAPQ